MTRMTVRHYMTEQPVTIGLAQTLAAAHRLMREHNIRHLPVLDAGKIVGLVSLHDLHLVETFGDASPELVAVEDAMTPEPYCVTPGASLEAVAREMAAHKYGSAVVVEHERVVGMFTTVDALHALSDLLGGKRGTAASPPTGQRRAPADGATPRARSGRT